MAKMKLIPGRIYGMGNIETKLVPYDVMHDHTIDELCIRRHKSSGVWTRLDEFEMPSMVRLLNDDLMVVEESEDQDDDQDAEIDGLSTTDYVNAFEHKILLHKAELEAIEVKIADRLGCLVGDGSPLSEELFKFVHNPDQTSLGALMDKYADAVAARDDAPVAA
jgi:hypothetical protein